MLYIAIKECERIEWQAIGGSAKSIGAKRVDVQSTPRAVARVRFYCSVCQYARERLHNYQWPHQEVL